MRKLKKGNLIVVKIKRYGKTYYFPSRIISFYEKTIVIKLLVDSIYPYSTENILIAKDSTYYLSLNNISQEIVIYNENIFDI